MSVTSSPVRWSPGHSDPADSVHEYGAVPPDELIVAVYGLPTVAVGTVAVVMARGVTAFATPVPRGTATPTPKAVMASARSALLGQRLRCMIPPPRPPARKVRPCSGTTRGVAHPGDPCMGAHRQGPGHVQSHQPLFAPVSPVNAESTS